MNKHNIFKWCLEQAELIVAKYRAEAPEGFEVFNQAGNVSYGGTDVMHDRKWIIANMAGRRAGDPIRLQMEAALQSLIEEERTGEQQKQFGIQQAGLEESRQNRMETSKANRESRELYQRGLADTRAERTSIAQEGANARRAAGLQLAMNDPNLSKKTFGG
jgi:hypothetical protein